jgi:hypothetical protein
MSNGEALQVGHLLTTSAQRVFSFAQIFFFALTYMSSWETMALNLQATLLNGGPRALAWGILIVVGGALAQSASLAEMSSAQPIAGAQYVRHVAIEHGELRRVDCCISIGHTPWHP